MIVTITKDRESLYHIINDGNERLGGRVSETKHKE